MKKLPFFSTLFFLIISVSSCNNEFENTDAVENANIEGLVKNISGEVVTEIPNDVYLKLIDDLESKNKSKKALAIKSNYTTIDNVTILNNETRNQLEKAKVRTTREPNFSYKSHLSGKGWTGFSPLGYETGSTGQGRQMEAILFTAAWNTPDFKARAYVAGKGWLPWVGLGEICGTEREKRRMEAIQIYVSPNYANFVEYKVHMSGIGWGKLVSNGEIAGTTNQNRQLEAFLLYMFII